MISKQRKHRDLIFVQDYTIFRRISLFRNQDRNQLIAGDIERKVRQGGTALVVSDRVEHLHTLAAKVKVRHRILTDKTIKKQRSVIVEEVRKGNIPVLFSTMSLIGEGFDVAEIDSLFLTTPIRFESRLTQVIGRILRPADGKQPLVFDYVDVKVGLLAHQAECRQRVYATLGEK